MPKYLSLVIFVLGIGSSTSAHAMVCEPMVWNTWFCEGYPPVQTPFSFWGANGMALVPPPNQNPHLPIRYVKCGYWHFHLTRTVTWQTQYPVTNQSGQTVRFPYPPDTAEGFDECGQQA